jgi:uncharacterized repeat protein (TIGR03803 family)
MTVIIPKSIRELASDHSVLGVRILGNAGKIVIGCGLALAIFVPVDGASARGFNVLYTFTGGNDGGNPYAALIDIQGNRYGTTYAGGMNNAGTVFKLAPDGTETVLYSFTGGSDGGNPLAERLIKDAAGNLYGTTLAGGVNNGGTVFRLAPDGTETVLHAFTGATDGSNPSAGLIANRKGDLFGTTLGGGANGDGTVFKVAPDGTETVLHAFAGGNDGAHPLAALIRDNAGNSYSTTDLGGTNNQGTVFKLAGNGTETVLYSFTGGNDGGTPEAGLISDEAGNLYGTADTGGANSEGVIFKLAPDGTETVLHAFTGGSDGGIPFAGLIKDAAGNLYGTTYSGGVNSDGTVFKLAPDGTETVLHAFTGGNDGGNPVAGLTANRRGHLFGTTVGGGTDGSGTIFELKE